MSTQLSKRNEKKIIADANDFARELSGLLNTKKTNFEDKGSIGLWWDAKGLFNSSDKDEVVGGMDMYEEIYEDVESCITLVENGDEKAYTQIQKLYGKLEEMEKNAKHHAEGNSKALCQVAVHFLDNNLKLDHKLKRVECLVLNKCVTKVKEVAKRLEETGSDNRNMKNSIDDLQKKNQDLGAENQELRNKISESEARQERRFQEMDEEHQRNMDERIRQISESLQKRDVTAKRLGETGSDNRNMKNSIDDLQKKNQDLEAENQELRNKISESEARQERRFQEMAEEHQRIMDERIRQILESLHMRDVTGLLASRVNANSGR